MLSLLSSLLAPTIGTYLGSYGAIFNWVSKVRVFFNFHHFEETVRYVNYS